MQTRAPSLSRLRILVYSFLLMLASLSVALPIRAAISVSGQVNGPPPATAPTITSPAENSSFSTNQVTVAGTCIAGLIVKVFNNSVFAGSAVCESGNAYSMIITLYSGRNELIARQYDFAEQASPDSDTVAVTYQPTVPAPSTSSGGSSNGSNSSPASTPVPLAIEYDYTVKGVTQDQPFDIPLVFTGGTGPYAISIAWGDGVNDVMSREASGKLTLTHTYKQGGFYTVVLRIADANGQTAYMQFVIIANGDEVTTPIVQHIFGQPIKAEIGPLLLMGGVGLAIVWFIAGFFTGRWWQRRRDNHDRLL